ncbi:MAG: ATP synthase F0 subunit B [bacterium]|nr:ATP synthase F0 subunit B [bacterium]
MRDVSRILLLPIAALTVLGTPFDAAAAALNLSPDFQLVGLNLLVFSLLIYPVNKLVIQPLLGVIQEREELSTGTAERADGVRQESLAAQQELETQLVAMRVEAQSKRVEILGDADQQERSILEQARERAGESIDDVRRTISLELGEARQSLQSDAQTLAQEAASKILGREL